MENAKVRKPKGKRNLPSLMAKAATHKVELYKRGNIYTFHVISGSSGKKYDVLVGLNDHVAECECMAGVFHNADEHGTACSHVIAVWRSILYNAGCQFELVPTEKQAQRRGFRPFYVGEGVYFAVSKPKKARK